MNCIDYKWEYPILTTNNNKYELISWVNDYVTIIETGERVKIDSIQIDIGIVYYIIDGKYYKGKHLKNELY